MVSYEADISNLLADCSVVLCGRGSLEGAIKTIIGTKIDLLVIFLCMKLLLNSTYSMIHSSIIIVCKI
jgi:hypothetical protein